MKLSPPNQFAHKAQRNIWSKYPSKVKLWIMFANFFFAVLPAVLYINERIHHNYSPSIDEKFTAFIVFQLFLLITTASQLYFYNRFMTFRLVRTTIFGQLVSLCLALLCLSPSFIKNIESTIKSHDRLSSSAIIFCFFMVISIILFLGFINSPFSENF